MRSIGLSDKFRNNKFLKNSAMVFFASIFFRGISFLVSILLARYLGVDEFGSFSLVQSNMFTITSVIDMGISIGFVKYASIYVYENEAKASVILNLILKLKLCISLIILLIGMVFSYEICLVLFKDTTLIGMFRISLLGILAETLYGYANNVLRIFEKFKEFTMAGILYGLTQVFVLINLSIIFGISGEVAMVSMVITPVVASIYSYLVIPKRIFKIKYFKNDEKTVIKELVVFTKWIMLSTICNTFINRVDIYMINYYLDSNQLGLFSAAQKMATIFPIITTTLTTVLLPSISKYKTKDQYYKLIKQSFRTGLVLIPILIVMLIVSKPLTLVLLGEEFIGAVIIFNILLVSYIFGIIINPISLILYNLNKEYILTVINFIQLVINVVGNYLLIFDYKAIGVAMSTTVVRVFGIIFILIAVFINVKNINE